MPDLDGVDTLLTLKDIFRRTGREIPVVCHTTEDARRNINLYKAAGFADVLIKPIQPREVSDILMTYLPEGRNRSDEADRMYEERIERELASLPEWLSDVKTLNLRVGIDHCDTAEDYMDTLDIFSSSIAEKAKEIEDLYDSDNIAMYTIKVHSLKSMARLVGAEELSALAADLEYAGKNDNMSLIRAGTAGLLKSYRDFITYLAPLHKDAVSADDTGTKANVASHSDDKDLPAISRDVLNEAYDAIRDFVVCYDEESILATLDMLKAYRLPYDDSLKINDIETSLKELNWEKLRGIMNSMD